MKKFLVGLAALVVVCVPGALVCAFAGLPLVLAPALGGGLVVCGVQMND